MNDTITLAKPAKPLGIKAYGSIGHLPNSRLGPGDHMVPEGQAAICTIKPRPGDRIVVTEKLDGANVAVASINGNLVALSRAGYRVADALYDHLRVFDAYVAEHHAEFAAVLHPGERIVGEWLAMAHGTLYDPSHLFFSPFVAFDIFRDNKRILSDEFDYRIVAAGMRRAFRLHDGFAPCSVDYALRSLSAPDDFGFHGAIEPVEGAVWRVEREGRVDFLAKYVRPDKVDGKYLPNIANAEPIWFWHPQARAA